ncbi:hypothetical protein HMI55_005302, partial [Coelomomyces lativittatus]
DIYLNLSGFSEFIHAVARDGRSYKRVWFQKAAGALLKTGQKSQSDIDLLSQFVEAVEAALLEESKEEEELGEIPDEFLDPIMFSLMEDPVILPTSGTTLDRSTITAHLLGEKRDPFNRKELKIEEVIPNTELKEKIKKNGFDFFFLIGFCKIFFFFLFCILNLIDLYISLNYFKSI